MLVSLNAIKKYVDISDLTPTQIADGLTYAGVEVEEVSALASGTNLVIGHILECVKHPDSDHLHVLKVDLGSKYGVEQIVCGAPNARKDLKVIVARVGAKLPDGEIKNGVIRGVESNGMCCSLVELGVNTKYLKDEQTKGIEELPNDAPVGEENVLAYLGLDDVVLNVKVLANRPDLLSIYNVAREIAAIFNKKVNIPTYQIKETFKSDIKVGSETNSCSQFSIREIRNIKVKDSPSWMKQILMSSGIRSINNIVDIGNYVMLLTGQPLHMYDADKLAKKELIVRDNYKGDFVALDDKTYLVLNEDIVITCNNEPMCLGGVMGSKICEVDENTKNVYIEAASFDGVKIRHTSNRLGLVSESSQRFVKGTNHFQYQEVLDFAADIMTSLCDAKEISNIVTFTNEINTNKVVKSSVSKINGRLGTSFNKKEIVDVLTRLYFTVEAKEDELNVTVPTFRLDVTCDADLSEEVIRILGFENVKSILPCLDTRVGALTLAQQRVRNIEELLLDNGLNQCLTYSLISEKEAEKFNLLNHENKYKILNPLTEDHKVFRSHVLHSLLSSATYNVSRQNKNLALFEISNVITLNSNHKHLAVVLVGKELNRGLMSPINYDFYHMKGIVTAIFDTLGIEKSRYKFQKLTIETDELHPGKSAEVLFQNQLVARFGEVHPNVYNEYSLGKTSCVVLEMELDLLLDAKVSINKMSPISRFPLVNHDLALVVNRNVSASDLIKTIKVAGKGFVKDANIFDIYEDEKVLGNKKSIAISISYGVDDRTLTDKEVNDTEDKIKFELTKAYQAELRN